MYSIKIMFIERSQTKVEYINDFIFRTGRKHECVFLKVANVLLTNKIVIQKVSPICDVLLCCVHFKFVSFSVNKLN